MTSFRDVLTWALGIAALVVGCSVDHPESPDAAMPDGPPRVLAAGARPDVTISGPTATTSTSPTFMFDVVATLGLTAVDCRVDAAAFAPCTSPYAPGPLGGGNHVVEVRASNGSAFGLAQHAFTITGFGPAVAFAFQGGWFPSATPTFSFAATSAAAPVTSQCRITTPNLPAPAFAACASPFTPSSLGDGAYALEVIGIDSSGSTGASIYNFHVDTVTPDVVVLAPPSPISTTSRTPSFVFDATSPDSPASTTCRVFVPPAQPALVPCTSPYTVPAPLADGSYFFEVDAKDLAGNVGVAIHAFAVDNFPPSVTVTTTPANPTANPAPTFSFIASPAPVTTACRIDAAAFAPCSSPYTVVPGVLDGAHTFTVKATDDAGNVAQASSGFVVDATVPIVQIAQASKVAATSSHTPAFAFAVTDAHPGSTSCAITGTLTIAAVACSSPFTTPALADGTYTIQIVGTDAAGNTGATSWDFTVDGLAPTVTITTGPGLTNDATPTFGFIATGAISTQCRFDSDADVPCNAVFSPLAALAAGAHAFVVTATDAAGNLASASRSFVVDTNAPVVAIVAAPMAVTSDPVATFVFTSEPSATFECTLDGSATAACTSPVTTLALASGVHDFHVRAIDAAGNIGSFAAWTFTLDVTPPIVTIALGPNGLTGDPTPTFAFTSEAGATFECRLDTDAFATCPALFTASPLADGVHVLDVRATDIAGNVGAVTSQAFTVDTTGVSAPDTMIATAPDATIDTPIAQLTFTSNDAAATFECSLDAQAFAACSSPYTTVALADGIHSFSVRALGALGYADPTPAVRTWVVDTTPAVEPTSDDGGCGCRSSHGARGQFGLAMLVGLVLVRRRRRA